MFGQRPTFGSTSTSFGGGGGGGFGTNTSSTGFGTSTFGRPAFGTPVSSQNQTTSSTPFGSAATTGKTSIFGSSQPSTGGLFGSSQPTGFGTTGTGFGSGGGLFGNSNTQSNTSGGLFGSSTSTSGFNANQKGPFSFGTTTTSSGTGNNLFGTSNTGTNLFSSSLGQSNGTVIKYNPVTGTDTMTRGGTTTNIQTKIEVITAMKEYENRSLEELRVEDYLAGRKGPQQQQQSFGFGQMSVQNKFGMNQPATSSNWLSGSTTGGTGLFGAKPPENKSLFGTNQNTGFGTSTSGSGGLFGSSNPSPFGQSTTAPSTGFSFGQNNQNKGFSFGQQQTSTAPLFGQPNTSTQSGSSFGSTGFSFGNQANQQGGLFGTQKTAFGSTNTGTGLFSNNKTTGTGFSGFGNTASSSSPFGSTNTNTTGGLFGSNNQNKTGFSLGTSTSGFGTGTSTFGTGGLFGSNTNQPKSGALTFGSSGGFGTNTSAGFNFNQPNTGSGGGLFGNTQNTGGGLFGNTTSNFSTGSNFGGGGNTFGMNTMQPNTLGNNLNFGNSNAPNVNNNNINNLIKALTHNPFGISSLLKDVAPPTGKADELLKSPTSSTANNPSASKSSVSNKIPTYVLPSGSAVNNVKPKPIGSNRLSSNLTDDTKKSFLFIGLEDKNESAVEDPFKIKPFPNVKRLNLKVFKNSKNNVNGNSSANGQNTATNSIINGNLNSGMSPLSTNHPPTSPGFIDTPTSQGTLTPLHDNSPTPDIIKGRSNIKRLQITNKNNFNDTLAELNAVNKFKNSNNRNDSAKNDLDTSDCNKENTNISLFDPPSLDDLNDLPNDHMTSSPHPAGIKFSRIGYYTMPSLEDLKEMVDSDGNCLVENFTVGRYGYGNICFQGITNVTGLDLDSIVFIVRKEVEVYPEGVTKPPVGEELNKPAFITLDCVWPVDKTTHEVIKSQERLDAMGWSQYLEKQCMKMDASFVEYRPETGSWVFKVKHFSKYGLQDDESDASSTVASQAQQSVVNAETITPKSTTVPTSVVSEECVEGSVVGDLGGKTSLTFSSGFPASLPMFGSKVSQSQGPPAVGLMSPPQFQGSHYGTELVGSPALENTFLDVTTFNGAGGNAFNSVVEEGNDRASFCPLSPSAERITLSSKVPVRAIQSLKSQLFFSDIENEVSPEDDYTGFGPSKERAEKRELFRFGEEVTGPSEALGKATRIPILKSSSKKLFTGDESMLNDVRTSSNDIAKTPSLILESTLKERTTKKTYSPTLQEPVVEETNIASSKSLLRDPKSEYQLLSSVPDPYFELGREEANHLQTKVSYKDSLTFDYSKGIADAGAFMGRSFRVGWGPRLTLVHGGAPLGSSTTAEENIEDEAEEEYQPHEPIYLFDREGVPSRHKVSKPSRKEKFMVTVEKLHLRDETLEMKEEKAREPLELVLEACLQKVLECSATKYPESSFEDTDLNITSKGDKELNSFPSTCHYFSPEEGIHLLHELVIATANLEEGMFYKDTKLSTVFQLCAALWGRLDFFSPDSDGDSEYALEQARKEALSVWLEEVSETLVEVEAERALSSEAEEGYIDAVFSYLTVLQISRACEICLENGDDHLALLLTQACLSDEVPRNIMKEQLKNWAWSGIDSHMSATRLALYTLISGKATHESSQGMINTCLGLDWRRCLALHMWFVCPTTASIAEVLKEYEKACGKILSKNNKDVPPFCEEPMPVYLSKQTIPDNPRVNDDVCYQLLKLYVDRFHPLDTLLETSAITSDPLDVTTSWLLWCVLQSLGYCLLSPTKCDALHTSMASLLEAKGSWHWAAFVLMFLKDSEKRRKELLELLTRHLLVEGEKGSGDPFYIEKEHFILNEVKIPEPWVYKAKAIKAKSSRLVDEEAWYLIKARNYNEAHKLVLETIAPNAIINEDHEYLLSYLNEFEAIDTNEMVVDWQNGGGIYRAYLEVVQQVNELKESQFPTGSKVEKLRPRLMALCLRLNNLKCPTAVHRLCISEISRMVISVLRALLSEDPQGIRVLAQQVTSLPLTHECALEELSHITHQYLTTLSRDTVAMETT